MSKEKGYFQCFSLPLKEFLQQRGIQSEFKARHIKTDRDFWLYLYDSEGKLDKSLNEWSIVRKQQ